MLYLDRFEEEKAVIYSDSGNIIIDRICIDKNVREGDALIFYDNKYYKDEEKTNQLKAKNLELINKLIK